MEWDSTSITYISFEAITGFVTVIGNSIVLIAILRTTSLHTVTNVFIGNLAIADIFVGIVVAPLAALSFLGLPKDVNGCIFINSTIVMLTNISILMLLAVAVERFIAISLPYTYKRIMTIRRALLLNGCIWTLGTIPGWVPMFGWNKAPDNMSTCSFEGVIPMEYMVYFQFFGFIILPLFTMFLIYVYIWHVIRKHMKQGDAFQRMFSRDRRSRSQWKKDVRAAKFFGLLIALFGLFWLPVHILNCITFFCPDCYQPHRLLLAAIVMSHANSSINPFLYAASNSRIQRAIMSLLKLKKLTPHSPDETSGIATNIAPTVGVSTISNNHNDSKNPEGYFHQPSVISLDQNKYSYPDCGSQNKPKKSSLKVRHSNEDLSNQTLSKIQTQNGEYTKTSSGKNAMFTDCDNSVAPLADRQTNNTDSQSIHTKKDLLGGFQRHGAGEQHTLDSPKLHKRPVGRVNFAFVDDDIDDDSSMTSSSQSNEITDKEGGNFKREETEMAHLQNEHRTKIQPEVKKIDLYNIDTLTTRKLSVVGITTQQNQQNIEERKHKVLDIKSQKQKRYGHLFEMESESLQEQEYSKIICVGANDENTDSKSVDDEQPGNADNRHNQVLHSYFSPKAKNGRVNVADVETNVILIDTELHHTKL